MQVYFYTKSKVCLFIGTVRSLWIIEESVTPIRPRQVVRLCTFAHGGWGGSGDVVSKMSEMYSDKTIRHSCPFCSVHLSPPPRVQIYTCPFCSVQFWEISVIIPL